MKFPEGFLWGASTSAYQIEGGNERSVLWDWEARRGWERSGRAADSWRLWREDVRCLKRLNLNAYRFSVEWSRVEPEEDVWREEVLRRYAEMAAELGAEGIRPIVCLHHFSEPAWLLRAVPKGWLDVRMTTYFRRFAARVVWSLGPHVQDWLTFNEPVGFLLWAYGVGKYPPGRWGVLSFRRTFETGPLLDNVLIAHEEACGLIRREVRAARVGIAQHVSDVEPARPGAGDLKAVQSWDRFMHRSLLDKAAASRALDFLGINYYTRIYVARARLPFLPMGLVPGYAEVEAMLGRTLFRALGGRRGDRPRTDMGWEIVPEGLERVVRRFWEAYGLPILITENGLADAEGDKREAFLRGHLESLHRALEAGARVFGYLHWSLIDNYEWGSFAPKFGLFRVDRANRFARTPAPGASFYAEAARRNGF